VLSLWPVAAHAQDFRVIAADAAVRLYPNENSELLATLPLGTVVSVDTGSGDWFAVYLPADANGVRRYGYMLARHLERVAQPDVRPATQPARQAPSTTTPSNRSLPSFDEEFAAYPKTGVYVGAGLWQIQPHRGGDFDGLHSLTDNRGLLIVVPSLADTRSLDLIVGGRFDSSAVEMRYAHQRHDGEWLGLPGEATYHEIDIDGRQYFGASARVQPFVSGGTVFQWLNVKEGSVSVTLGQVGDATLTGVSFQGGGGVTGYPHPRLGITGGLTYRFEIFTRARGVGGTWEDAETLYGRRLRVGGTVTFTF
jgi:hypothetical protein